MREGPMGSPRGVGIIIMNVVFFKDGVLTSLRSGQQGGGMLCITKVLKRKFVLVLVLAVRGVIVLFNLMMGWMHLWSVRVIGEGNRI